jgi:hypothetical protein
MSKEIYDLLAGWANLPRQRKPADRQAAPPASAHPSPMDIELRALHAKPDTVFAAAVSALTSPARSGH